MEKIDAKDLPPEARVRPITLADVQIIWVDALKRRKDALTPEPGRVYLLQAVGKEKLIYSRLEISNCNNCPLHMVEPFCDVVNCTERRILAADVDANTEIIIDAATQQTLYKPAKGFKPWI